MLDLEIAGEVRDLTTQDTDVANAPVSIKRLRDSHHAVARLLAEGLTPFQVSLQTGYSPSRISILQRDPSFGELLAFYRTDVDKVRMQFEHRMALVAEDALQELHEDLDAGALSAEQKIELFKLTADRAGFAPISRSITKSVNVNIGDRLDAARARLRNGTER